MSGEKSNRKLALGVAASAAAAYALYSFFQSQSRAGQRKRVGDAKVVVVGASNIDLITYVDRCPVGGETIHGNDFAQGFGGKGANQAVMAARLGAPTAIVTCVGNDDFGKQTIENFSKHGMDTSYVTRAEGKPTGVAPIWVDGTGENRIIIVNGANDMLTPEDVSSGPVLTAGVLLCQLEIKKEITLCALRAAKKAGVLTVLNPAPASDIGAEFYQLADIVAPNQSEAEILTGVSAATEAGAQEAAQVLISKGAKVVVMTLGAKGCLVMSAETKAQEATVFPCPSIDAAQVRDTAGAGDCFLGAFAYHLARGDTLQRGKIPSHEAIVKAATFGSAAATFSVMGLGTQSSYPTLEEVLELGGYEASERAAYGV